MRITGFFTIKSGLLYGLRILNPQKERSKPKQAKKYTKLLKKSLLLTDLTITIISSAVRI